MGSNPTSSATARELRNPTMALGRRGDAGGANGYEIVTALGEEASIGAAHEWRRTADGV